MIVMFLIGCLPFIYLPIRAAQNPAWNWGDPSTLVRFLRHVTLRQYSTYFNSTADIALPHLKYLLIDNLLYLGIILVILGIIKFYKNRLFFFVVTSLFFNFVFFLFYQRKADYFLLPSLFLLLVFFSFGLLSLIKKVKKHVVWIYPILILLLLVHIFFSYTKIDLSNSRGHHQLGEDILNSLDDDSVLIVTSDTEISPLIYLQYVEGYRPEVVLLIMNLVNYDWYLEKLSEREIKHYSYDEISSYIHNITAKQLSDTESFSEEEVVLIKKYVLMDIINKNNKTFYLGPGVGQQVFIDRFSITPEGPVFRLNAPGSHALQQDYSFPIGLSADAKLKELVSKMYLDRGNYYYFNDDYDRALAEYLKAESVMPSIAAFNNIAAIYYGQQKYIKAIEYWQKILEEEPANEIVRNNIAAVNNKK